jgi:hypothetical protein
MDQDAFIGFLDRRPVSAEWTFGMDCPIATVAERGLEP